MRPCPPPPAPGCSTLLLQYFAPLPRRRPLPLSARSGKMVAYARESANPDKSAKVRGSRTGGRARARADGVLQRKAAKSGRLAQQEAEERLAELARRLLASAAQRPAALEGGGSCAARPLGRRRAGRTHSGAEQREGGTKTEDRHRREQPAAAAAGAAATCWRQGAGAQRDERSAAAGREPGGGGGGWAGRDVECAHNVLCAPCPAAPRVRLCVQAKGSDLRVHFKNTRESAFALRKMSLNKAKKYLEDVLAHKRCIPFRRYQGAVGRTSQAKNEKNPGGQGRWPVKSAEFLLNLLKNAEANAEVAARRLSGGAGRGRDRRGRRGPRRGRAQHRTLSGCGGANCSGGRMPCQRHRTWRQSHAMPSLHMQEQ